MLAWTIYISFLGVAGLCCLPRANAAAARKLALVTALAGLAVALTGFIQGAPEFRAGKMIPL
ncbi:MAG: hypothetical protein RMK20_16555, partial [Verrucomicrobiales bacterium]|nr:hypothetical protein [Verrucomicrobiales bacterium]